MKLLSRMTGFAAPDRSVVRPGYAIAPPEQGVLAQLLRSLGTVPGDDKSAVHLLGTGVPAFAARLALIDAAQYSLDLQYYLFHRDQTGTLLAWSLWQAAERGVRVRLLLDDMERRPEDSPLVALDAHPNIEVRFYNPFFCRRWRGLQLLMQFPRLNHRMHNKSLTADNLLTIVGGRNLGDEYFEFNQRVNFGDLDVLALGPVVTEVSRAFDDYWNADQVYPLSLLRADPEASATGDAHTQPPAPEQQQPQQLQDYEQQHRQTLLAMGGEVEQLLKQHYFRTVTGRDWLDRLLNNQLPLIRAPVQLWFDVPDFTVSRINRVQARRLGISRRRYYSKHKRAQIRSKDGNYIKGWYSRHADQRAGGTTSVNNTLSAQAPAQHFVIEQLLELFDGAEKELFLVSPYCVTREAGTQLLIDKAREGVKVSMVTNSLAATDILAVHACYTNYRKELLRGGVSLYEVKTASDIKRRSWSLSSMSSLHAKTFIVDRRWVFIGSFNLDPRSAWINTETGMLIDSPEMAEDMLGQTESLLEQIAYRVELYESRLSWLDLADQRRYFREPRTRLWRQLSAGLLSLLPLESQL